MDRQTDASEPTLVADRFVALIHEESRGPIRAFDLATGEEVLLVVHDRCAAEAAWATRCDWLRRIRHRALAPLIDAGCWTPSATFEAWQCGPEVHANDRAGDELRATAARFLAACGRTDVGMSSAGVHQGSDGPIVVAPHGAGFEGSNANKNGELSITRPPLAERGVLRVDRTELRGLADALGDAANDRTRALAVWGVEGSGLASAVADLARAARLQGVVPLSAAVAGAASPMLRRLLAGRSVMLIDRLVAKGWPQLVEWGRRSPRPHVVLFAGRHEMARVEGLALKRLSAEALVRSVEPPVDDGQRRVSDAAQAACGLPGRFVRRIWGRVTVSAGGRVAEQPPVYGACASTCLVAPVAANSEPWAQPAEIDRWRVSSERAVDLLRAGRRAAGERMLRAAVGALRRRADWVPARRGLAALAAAHLSRGRPFEAQRVLREIEECGDAQHEAPSLDWQVELALLEAAALGDLGHAEQSEQVLTTTLVAAHGVGDAEACRRIRLSLSRIRFWLGRFEEAWRGLDDTGPGRLNGAGTIFGPRATGIDVRGLAARSRVQVARGRHGAAIAEAAAALRLAERLRDPGAIALAAQASAFAFMAVGDPAAAGRDAARAVELARAARDPIRLLKARLLVAECNRHARDRVSLAPWVRRAARLQRARLPITVHSRLLLLADQSGLGADEAVRRRIAATGLRALSLFAGRRSTCSLAVSGPEREPADSGLTLLEDMLDLLRCCQGNEEREEALVRVLRLLRERLRAAGAGCYLAEEAGAVPAGVDGRRPSGEIAARVLAAQQPLAPQPAGGSIEAGAPVRFDGRTIGAFVARWSLGSPLDTPRAHALLVAAATVAAPVVAATAHRRRTLALTPTDDLLGVSQAIREVRCAIESAAAAPYAVLVEGESGSGKELVARAVHRRSPRRDRPFCALNCAALPDDLLEAELFGHTRGAFTGAMADRLGVFEAADGGTLFLDEIGELSPRAQAKLLRAIQEGEIRRVGENIPRRIDVRVVAATNRDLRQESSAGRFRLDLLYRLDVVRITLTPLRTRREDIPVLVEHFWREAAARVGTRATLSWSTLGALSQYDWPGNVRELQNVLASLAVRSPRRGVVQACALPAMMAVHSPDDSWRLESARRTFEERFVRAALVRSGGQRTRAARELGVSRQGLAKLMARLGIRDNQDP